MKPTGSEGIQFEYEVLIREGHLDTFGHVNNATYLQLFEEARWEFISQRNFGLAEIKKSGLGPIILEIKIKYQREIGLRERIRIRSKTEGYKGKIGFLQQVMINEKNEVCCVAEMTMGLFDTSSRRLIPPTPEWLFAIGLVENI